MRHDNRENLETLFQNEKINLKRGFIFDVNPDPMPSYFDFDRFEGMMLGLAVGDALGNTTEGMVPEQRYNHFGEIRDYLPNRHADEKRVGTPSDDTQLAFWTLDQLIDDDGLVPDRLASRFCRDQIFGIGGTIQKFILNQKNGKNWTESGPQSAGNGALMRIAPVVFPHLRSGGRDLWVDTAISAMLTHNDTASISACIAFVYILWQLLKMDQPPAPDWWHDTYCAVTKDLELRTIYRPRSRAVKNLAGSLRDFVKREVLSAYHSGTSITDACNKWFSGAYMLETVPVGLHIDNSHPQMVFVGELPPQLPVNEGYPNLGPRVSMYTFDGKLLTRLGDLHWGEGAQQFIAPHGIATDSKGNIYVGEVSYGFIGNKLDPPRELPSFRKLVKL